MVDYTVIVTALLTFITYIGVGAALLNWTELRRVRIFNQKLLNDAVLLFTWIFVLLLIIITCGCELNFNNLLVDEHDPDLEAQRPAKEPVRN